MVPQSFFGTTLKAWKQGVCGRIVGLAITRSYAATYYFEGRIIFAAIFTTKPRGATLSDSIIRRFIAPEIT